MSLNSTHTPIISGTSTTDASIGAFFSPPTNNPKGVINEAIKSETDKKASRVILDFLTAVKPENIESTKSKMTENLNIKLEKCNQSIASTERTGRSMLLQLQKERIENLIATIDTFNSPTDSCTVM
ncbi:MAG: hypothetical protein K9M07_07760 [Simkaniaceae bacterium]|nr:hypothetical protein [Simkaniaceae bacterium]MCF7853116.1 hypothetical protein [Simkaniaceae bacterium]